MRGIACISVAALLVLAACGGQSPVGPTPTIPPPAQSQVSAATGGPAPLQSQTGAAPAASPASSREPSPLEGVWHTGVVTPDDAMAVLQAAGLQEYAQAFLNVFEFGDENVFTLRISGGRWVLYWARDGGLAREDDSGAYAIDGDTVTIRHNGGGTDTHQWSVNGDTLRITYVSDTFADDPQLPHFEEMAQRVLYMSSSWIVGAP